MLMCWLFLLTFAVTLPLSFSRFRSLLMWSLPLCGLALLAVFWHAAPWAKLLASSLGMLIVMKGTVLASYPLVEVKQMRWLLYFLWPGMDPTRLTKRGPIEEESARPIPTGLANLYIGIAILLGAIFVPMPIELRSWIGILGLLIAVHCGLSDLVSGGFKLCGFSVRRLFDRPLQSKTLNEFWTKRWNVPFVEMDRRLFFGAIARRMGPRKAILGVFLVSGLLHEMAISYPAGSGFGLPLLFFAIQGTLVLVESKLHLRSRLFTWCAILIPLPLLFTAAFRKAFIYPLLAWIQNGLAEHGMAWYFDKGIWIMGIAHFLVLVASFQVPTKLGWKDELPRLSSFNRKLMYAYGAFIVFTIITFGAFTLLMHQEMLAGSRPALLFAGFISGFWALRIGLDAFYYKHEDWPRGAQFVVGHALLTSLFSFLSLSYASLLVWHALA